MSRYYDYDTLCKGMHDVVLKNGALHRCIDDIKILDLPTADVRKNVKGEWIVRRGIINCSVCKHCSWSEAFEDLVKSFKYCPNCGADMRGEA